MHGAAGISSLSAIQSESAYFTVQMSLSRSERCIRRFGLNAPQKAWEIPLAQTWSCLSGHAISVIGFRSRNKRPS